MQEEIVYKLILNRKEYLIPSDFPSFDDVDSYIHSILITKREYIVKSDISEIVFQSFLNNWINKETPNLRIDNINEYELISDEFDRMKAAISLFKSHISNTNSTYLQKCNHELSRKTEKRHFKLNKEIKKFHLIIDHIFNTKEIDSHKRFLEIRTDLYKACKKGKVNSVYLLTKKKIENENGFSFTINEEEKTAGILHFHFKKEDIFIPRSITYKNDEYLITVIHSYAFQNSEIRSITFDENSELKTIEKNAFFDCSELYCIKIPKHVTYIGKYAFNHCSSLNEIIFDENSEIEIIEICAFTDSSISNLTIPSSIVGFRDSWCFDTKNLKNITVFQNNNKNNFLFYDDKFLIGKSNPDKNEMDVLVFARRDLKEAEIPSFIRVIRDFAFQKCESLEKVVFSKDSKLEIIERSAFSKTSIKSISIPDSVTYIHETCFYDCEKLENVEFSSNSNLYSIGGFAFAYSQLSHSNHQIPFENFNIFPGYQEQLNFGNQSGFENFNIFNPFQSGNFCFFNGYQNQSNFQRKPRIYYRSFQNLSIPSSVVDLKECWCSELPNLKNIKINQNDIQNIQLIEGKIIVGKSDLTKDEFDVILFASRDIKDVVIPSNIKRIAANAFSYCSNIEKVGFSENSQLEVIEKFAFSETLIQSITIPPSVIEIQDCAFYKCISLSEIIFSPDSKLNTIGKNAFYCTSIKNITLPSSIRKLKNECFNDISDLNNVSIMSNNEFFSNLDEKFLVGKSSPNSVNYDVILFSRKDIKEAIIPSFIKRISRFAFNKCKNLEKVEFSIESELECIDENAFENSSISDITIPSNVKEIGKNCFLNCYHLQKVNFMNNSKITMIKKNTFSNTSIESITIPSNVIEIEKNAFYECTNLHTVNFLSNSKLQLIDCLAFSSTGIEHILIPSSVSIIDDQAFQNCKNLKTVDFSDNSTLKFIGYESFQGTSIERIKIPPHVSQIGENAFGDCKKLKTIEFSQNCELCLIKEFAFANTAIEFLLIPQSVTYIGESAFFHCSYLKAVEFSENSNLKYFGKKPFFSSKIERISIPEKFVGIRNKFFKDTQYLTDISIVSSMIKNDDDYFSITYYDEVVIEWGSQGVDILALIFGSDFQ